MSMWSSKTLGLMGGLPSASPAIRTGGGKFGVGTVAGLSVLAGVSSAVVTLIRQAMTATRVIEAAAVDAALAEGTLVPPSVPGATHAQQRASDLLAQIQLPQGDGVYSPDGRPLPDGHQHDDFLTLVMLGDSTSVGYGATHADDLPGVILARGLADHLHRAVRLRTHGLTGATSADLSRQLDLCLAEAPDAVVILVGANDVRDMTPPWRSAAQLGATVAKLTSRRIPVVVGTCPDFGVITPIPQPLRSMLSQWSLRLAALQERAVADAAGCAVAIAKLVSPQFVDQPDLFAPDHFHPSGAGYRRAMDVLLPALIEETSARPLRQEPADPAPTVDHAVSA